MFCDLLAQAPLNPERNASVRDLKPATLEQVEALTAEPLGLTGQQGVDATATSPAGALWQTATPACTHQNGLMTQSRTVGTSPDDYDAMHRAAQNSPLLHELWARAMGDEYPLGVEPTSSCSWWLLGHAVSALRLRPGTRLVDLGCGRGGPGLWLARALSVRLTGIDFSAAAVEIAAQRAGDYVAPERAEFHQRSFEQTGLPDRYADGLLSIDALPFSPDRLTALREAGRILAPGGRFVLTAREQPAEADGWPTMAASAGFDVELILDNTGHDGFWRRLFASYPENAAALRAELGDRAADNLLLEAELCLANGFPRRPAQLLVLRRDSEPAP